MPDPSVGQSGATDWLCPDCGFSRDTPNHELGCATGRDELLRALGDTGTSECLAALDTLRTLIERAQRDAQLLDGREYNAERFDEAYRLLDTLRAREARR